LTEEGVFYKTVKLPFKSKI